MAYPYSNPRASAFIATDEIPTVQYRRNSRRLSEIKLKASGGLPSTSSQNLLDLSDPARLEEDDNGTDKEELHEEYYAPEGKWGWITVAAAFLANFVVDGISLSYGILTDDITAKLKINKINETTGRVEEVSIESTISELEFNTVGSILLAVTLLTGPFASILAEKFGFRKTAMCGSIVAALGLFLSWALSPKEPNFWAFAIGFGFLAGVGFGILFTTSVVIVGKYFDKNVAIATGITVAGTGVGTLAMAPIIDEILDICGWQGAILFEAVLAAVSILFGAIYQPLPKRVVSRRKSEVKRMGMPIRQQLKELLCSPSYLIICFSGSLVMMGYFAPFGFLKVSAEPYIGEKKAVFLIAILGIANAVGRVLFALLANKIGHTLHISNIALTVGGFVTIFCPFATTHGWLIVCAVVFGSYASIFASLRSVIIKKVVGDEKFNVGFGLSLMFMGLATFFSNSLGGYLQDEKTKKYDMSFYVAGAFLTLSAVICYPLPWIYKYEKGLKSKREDDYQSSAPRRSLIDINIES